MSKAAQAAYEAYQIASGYGVQPWDGQPDHVKARWEAVAKAARLAAPPTVEHWSPDEIRQGVYDPSTHTITMVGITVASVAEGRIASATFTSANEESYDVPLDMVSLSADGQDLIMFR